VSGDEVAKRIVSLFPGRFLRGYVSSKLRTDPVYAATARVLRGHLHPLFDLGCGVGLLGAYLREHGYAQHVIGVDHDARKIGKAQRVADRYPQMEFRVADIRDPFPRDHSIAALDILHYFSAAEQRAILERVAEAIPPGGVAVIRDCVRDDSLRYRLTLLQERAARAVRWLRAERLRFATRDEITAPFTERGFAVECAPLWGRTPFNNYFFVFRRPRAGSTNE
jgi:SAM-dependent methyltransferase